MKVFPVFLAGCFLLLFCTIVKWEAETAVSAPPTPLISFEELPNLDTFGQGVIDITHAGDDRLFLAIRHGQIRTYDLSTEQMLDTFADAFLDISSRVDSTGEGGLLGIAFSPSFATDGYLYTSYTTSGTLTTTLTTVISRFSISQTAPNRADPASEHILMQFERPTDIHVGGDIAFGPDSYLYISQGDGGQPENAQELNDLFGSILRIDVTGAGNPPDCSPIGQYTIPPDNPLADVPGGNCDEIWSYGLRNPWRLAFDRLTGDLFIGDVGRATWEEIDFQPADSPGGQNYGWNFKEGSYCYPPTKPPTSGTCSGPLDMVDPIVNYLHADGTCAVVGGTVYRGTRYPFLVGHYLYTDWCSGQTWSLVPDPTAPNGWDNTFLLDAPDFLITSYGEDATGEIYVTWLDSVRRLQENTPVFKIYLPSIITNQ